jgi:putative acetyltransferase
MSLKPPAGVSLRPYLARDLPRITAIFGESIEALTMDDYDSDQRAAWAASADDEAKFGADLERCVTLVAEAEGEIVSFIALKNNDTIDMLYTAPDHAGRGIASFLCQAIEMLAQGRKAIALKVQASDSAYSFFEKRGFAPMQRNTVSLRGEWLANTSMRKELRPESLGGKTQ